MTKIKYVSEFFMKIDILTLFPEMFSPLNESILKRAKQNNIIDVNLVNIRDFSLDPNKRCDDYCYGGHHHTGCSCIYTDI